jgi:hypothetical protein
MVISPSEACPVTLQNAQILRSADPFTLMEGIFKLCFALSMPTQPVSSPVAAYIP